ncbi:MAG: PQQ-binding-like beta-propeller repeat protein [Planctomycetota bacterium]
MRKTIGLAMMVGLVLVAAGCGSEKVAVTEETVLAGVDLKYHWTLDLQIAADGVTLERIWQMDGEVYCLTSDSELFCVDAEIGHIRWSIALPDEEANVFQPSHYDGMLMTEEPLSLEQIQNPVRIGQLKPFDAVLVNTLSRLLVIDRDSTGTPKVYRNIELDFAANTGATTDGESAFIGSTDGFCQAVLLGAAVPRWDLDLRTQVKARPEAHDRLIYVAGTARANNTFYCLRSGDEYEVMWRQQLPGPVAANFHVDSRGCFVPCKRNVLKAFDVVSGDALWPTVSMEGLLTTPVQVSSNSVFQYADYDKFYAINIIDGSVRWTMPEARMVLAVIDGKVYLRDASDNLRIVNEVMGSQEGTLPLAGFDFFVPNTETPAIFTATRDGRLFCISPTDQASVVAAE